MGEQLDPEAVRELMSRYFHTMRDTIEGHGGTVEKFIGDAVMAVFGVPESHEDDALRALRAAADMQRHMGELNVELARTHGQELRMRIGVNTGEVVAGHATSREALVTGDAVNLAARLEQAATPGEVLIGPTTYRLVAHAVTATPTSPLALKGKADSVEAFKLLAIVSREPRAVRVTSELIGRDSELANLNYALKRVRITGRAELVTIVGEAGVGKSRLVIEFLARLGERFLVLRGRCLSYGEGITYWPVGEIARAAAAISGEDDADLALAKLESVIGGDDGSIAALRVGQAIGLIGGVAPAQEIRWAVRRMLESAAGEIGAIVVIDDLQWAESGLRDLLRHLATGVQAPVLIIGLARQDLLTLEPDWPGYRLLEPLQPNDVARLIATRLDTGSYAGRSLAQRLVAKAGGNPLFAEELLAALAEDGTVDSITGRVRREEPEQLVLPQTLDGLLSARIDRLSHRAREALEAGSVEGEVFHVGAVQRLTEGERRIDPELERLEEARWIHSVPTDFVGETAFRFRHILVRDAVYQHITKRRRADLHRRFADWLRDRVGPRLAEFEEILGYHLEQAYRYRMDLGPPDADTLNLGNRAGALLHAAGRRAILRVDPAAGSLLRRGTEIVSDARLRAQIEIDFAAIPQVPMSDALTRLGSVRELAAASGADAVALQARIEELWILSRTDPSGEDGRMTELGDIIDRLRLEGDPLALAKALRIQAEHSFWTGQSGLAQDLIDEVAVLAREEGDELLVEQAIERRLQYLTWGQTEATEGLGYVGELLEGPEPLGLILRTSALLSSAVLLAMRARPKEADAAMQEAASIDARVGLHSSGQLEGVVLMLGDDLPRAERVLRDGLAWLEDVGNTAFAATTLAFLARVLLETNRHDEAMERANAVATIAPPDDVASVVPALCVRAEVLALHGEPASAVAICELAVNLANATDFHEFRGEAWLSMARALAAGEDVEGARRAAQAAEDSFDKKGNLVYGSRAYEFRRSLM